MKKLIAIIGIVSLVTCGCRTQITNVMNTGDKSDHNAEQIAGKDYSDLLNGTEAAVGPLSRTGGSTGNNGAPTPAPEAPAE